MDKYRYPSLDGLRAIACIGIVLMHVKSNILVKPDDGFLTTNLISFTSNFVLLFMMVSAFSLCCGYYVKFKTNKISIPDFYRKRYIRILPFFAFLSFIDIVKTLFSEHFSFNEVVRAELCEAYTNVTLLFGLIPGNDITVVGVGWFLGIIFLFYLIFPFFTFMLDSKRKSWFWLVIVLGLYFVVKEYFNPVKDVSFGNNSFMQCFPFFLVGGMCYLYKDEIVDKFGDSCFVKYGGGQVYYDSIYYYLFPLSSVSFPFGKFVTLYVVASMCNVGA